LSELPLKLVVSDELQRRRLTVLFRLVLVIPHLVWLAVWGFGALLLAICNWVATLFVGISPESFHEFLAAYIRYATHVYAYLYLAADRYPGFLAQREYPVDLVIAPRARQNRWSVGFRLILAIPATLLGGALANSSLQVTNLRGGGQTAYSGGLLIVCGLLGWFASLVSGRMPRGLRDAVCYALFFSAQLMAYWFVLSDSYPNPDPGLALSEPAAIEHPVALRAVEQGMRRSRLTVFFRALLTIPHLVWLLLWGIPTGFAIIANWFATLATGTPPAALHRFIAAYVRYQAHVLAYLYLLANPFPAFDGRPGRFPLDLQIAPPQRQNRWTVLFRIVLVVPALMLASAYSGVLSLVAIFGWFASLVTARMPRGLLHAGELGFRYTLQMYAYASVLTDRYPYSGPLAGEPATASAGPDPPPGPGIDPARAAGSNQTLTPAPTA
jgi:Domain of unknown function (DUF4389)